MSLESWRSPFEHGGRLVAVATLVLAAACTKVPAADTASLHTLARDGYAQLENEDPGTAVDLFLALRDQLPDDPLPHGNLALALLRSERADEARAAIDAGVERFPDDPDLLAILATIQHWQGEVEVSLTTIRRAADLAPDNPEIQFSLYRIAEQLGDDVAMDASLDRLARLRPENLVVLLTRGKRALAQAATDAEAGRTAATGTYLRVRELTWDNPDASQALDTLLQALSDNRMADTRTPSIQLENLLKVTPAYRQSLRELETGIQGIPIRWLRQTAERPPAASPSTLTFDQQSIADETRATVAVTFVGTDEAPHLVSSGEFGIERRSLSGGDPIVLSTQEAQALLLADIDNDGYADAVVSGSEGVAIARGTEEGFEPWADSGLNLDQAAHAVALDYDIEGDLDLAVATDTGVRLFRNALDGPLTEVTKHAGGIISDRPVTALHAVDLDLDGDVDLVGIETGQVVFWPNLRQGEFGRRELGAITSAALATGDFDNDADFELVVADAEVVRILDIDGDEVTTRIELPATGVTALAVGDLDADGRQDLLAAGEAGVTLWQNTSEGLGDAVLITEQPVLDLALVDADRDCDLDVLLAGPGGLKSLVTQAEPQHHCLRVKLRGLTEGSSKNNVLGLGSLVEVSAGERTMTAEMQGEEQFFGLGDAATADLLRVLWTNGVPQNRFDVGADATVVEEQLLKGSCPFLYAWDGEGFAFVTDLLWGSPAGLPVAPGVWAGADPSELVHIPQAQPRDGRLELRVTEELWEAAFFDHLRLWVVEVDDDLEVASSLRILPGRSTPEAVHATAAVRSVVAATDAAGRDVTSIVATRDEVYADGWSMSPYQGVPAEPWTLELDLEEAPAAPIRLLLDGWIFPADASLNLAVAQRTDLRVHGPRVEVEVAGQWHPLADDVGFPAGKTKTMVVDLPPLPVGANRLRLVAAQWLSFDRIAWSTNPADDAIEVVDRLLPAVAELRYRGYSAPVRRAPNAPHSFDYSRVSDRAPWLPFPGSYTAYGDVRELLAEPDDRSVILAAGDEIKLEFELGLPSPPTGRRYEYFLESHGWDKDADRNTYEAAQVEPLPFRAMSGYPFAPGEQFPDTPEMREYRDRWLTREVR